MIHPDVWIVATKRQIDNTPGKIVIDDVRFPNEGLLLQQYGAPIWHITRPGLPEQRNLADRKIEEVPFDKLIMNAGSIPELYRSIDALMADLAPAE